MKPVKSKTRDEPIDVVVKAIVAGKSHQSSAADAQWKEHLSGCISPHLYNVTSFIATLWRHAELLNFTVGKVTLESNLLYS